MRLNLFGKYSPTFSQRLRIWATKLVFGPSTEDPAVAAFYRPELLARNFYKMQHRLLRGKSKWSVEEREFFAAFTSFHTYCEFCKTVHSHFASTGKAPSTSAEYFIQNENADLSSKAKAILPFLEKLTKQPWNLRKQDIEDLYQQGLTVEEVEDAAMVGIDFNIGSRLSDALDFEIPSLEALRKAKPIMRWIGYSFYT